MATKDLINHPGYWLEAGAADSLARLERDHGVININSAGRTEGSQQGLINRWDAGGWQNRPPYLYEPARPARTSPHVIDGGTAIDTSEISRMLRISPDYGWYRSHAYDIVHFKYDPSRDKMEPKPPTPANSTGGYTGAAVKGVHGPNPFGIPYTGGLQVIARRNGYKGAYDQNWGDGVTSGSMNGFVKFLKGSYGYSGNNELGPVMWKAIQRWLKKMYGYEGDIDGIPGPQTRRALLRADTANWAVRANY